MMERTDLKMRYFEEEYKMLTTIGGQKADSVVLVKRKTDGKIYVKKQISLEAVTVYGRLKNVINRNMTRVYDVACDGDKGIVIEEFINGITLAEYMDQVGILKEGEVCPSFWIFAMHCRKFIRWGLYIEILNPKIL